MKHVRKLFTSFVLLILVFSTISFPVSADPVERKVLDRTTAMERLEELELKRGLEDSNFQMGMGLSEELREGYSRLVFDFPNDAEIGGWSEYRLAEYDYSRDRFEEAIKRLEALSRKYASREIALEAKLLIVEIYESPYNPNRDETKANQIVEQLSQSKAQEERVQVKEAVQSSNEALVSQMGMEESKSILATTNSVSFKAADDAAETPLAQLKAKKLNEDIAKLSRNEALLEAKDEAYENAAEIIDQAVENYSGDNPYNFFTFSTTMEDLEYQQALLLVAQNKVEEAQQKLQDFVKNNGNSYLAVRAQQKLEEMNPEYKRELDSPRSDAVTSGMLDPGKACMCGPVSLRVALKEQDYSASLPTLMKNAGTTADGTTIEGLIEAIKAEGFDSFAYRITPNELDAIPMPSIVLLNDHYITLTERDGARFVVYDSLKGWELQSKEDITTNWTSNVITFSPLSDTLKKAVALTKLEQQSLKGRYLCGNTGGNPGDPNGQPDVPKPRPDPNDPNPNDPNEPNKPSSIPIHCSHLYAWNSMLEDDRTYVQNDEETMNEDSYGIGGGSPIGCKKASPATEWPTRSADGYMDGMVSSVNRVYGNHSLKTPRLLLRGSEYSAIQLALSYNSQASTTDSIVGKGWEAAYLDHLIFVSGNVQWVMYDGTRFTFVRNVDQSFTPPPGCLHTLSQDSDGNYIITLQTQEKYIFSKAGKLQKILDENGMGIYLQYNADGQMSKISDSYGVTVNVEYGSNKKVSRLAVDEANYVNLSYDASGFLVKIVFPDESSWGYQYSGGFLTGVTDRLGNDLKFEYNSYGQLTSKENAKGKRMSFGSSFTDYAGAKKNFDVDGARRVTSVTNQLGKKINYSYNADNLLTSVMDAKGNKLIFNYDASGNITSSINALGYKTAYTYDDKNRIIEVTDPLGKKITNTYDDRGNLLSIKTPGGAVSKYTYDQKGNVVAYTNPSHVTVQFEFDAYNRPLEVIGPKGRTASYEYDSLGRKIAETDAEGNRTGFKYDFFGHVIEIEYPDGGKVTRVYRGDFITSETDAKGNTTTYQYDNVGQLIKKTFANGGAYEYEYDAMGRETLQKDPAGNITRRTYDAKGKLTSAEFPGGLKETYEYDEADQLVKHTNTDGITTTYYYDAIGRVIREESE